MDDGGASSRDGGMASADQEALEARRKRRASRRARQQMKQAAMAAATEAAADAKATPQDAGDGEGGGGGKPLEKVMQLVDPRPSAEPEGEAEPAQSKGGAVAPRKSQQVARKPKQAELAPVSDEAFEIARVQRQARMREIRGELRRRRRWRTAGILFRFLLFVILPTSFVAWYYYEKATDMYVSESTLTFKSGTNSTAGGGLLGAIMGGGAPTDSVALQEYMLSRDILQRLIDDHDWMTHFQSEEIDEWHRLEADATLDDAHSYYVGGWISSGKIAVSYDIAEGVVRIEVTGATKEAAQRFAQAIIGYGEELVNSLNERSQNDGVRMAEKNVADAREALRDAQRKVADVQEKLNIFDVGAEAGALQSRIVALETEIDEILAQIAQLKTITRNENDSRFVPYRTDLEIKTQQLRQLRTELTGGGEITLEGPSMAQLSASLELARVDQATTQMMYASALSSLETAIESAASQSLYLETVVQPNLPVKSDKPNRLKNIGLVFLVLFAMYIIGLLTISLIREQAAI